MKINEILNPKLFEEDKLKDEVREQLLQISEEFLNDIETPLNIIDIQIVGSQVNYNYTDKSDIDLHIIVNNEFSILKDDVLQNLYNFEKSDFNNKYNATIYDIPVELYIEDIHSGNATNGRYSIVEDDWVLLPTKYEQELPNIDDLLSKEIDEINNLIEEKDIKKIQDKINNIYIKRKYALENEGEYSVDNLVFKALRDEELIQKLKDSFYNLRSEYLSLNKRKKIMESAFEDYKEKGVKYDIILEGSINIEMKNDYNKSQVEETLDSMFDEDMLAIYFKNVNLGAVYEKSKVSTNKITMTFGIVDKDEKLDIKELKESVAHLLSRLDKNLKEYNLEIKTDKENIKVINKKVKEVESLIFEQMDRKLVKEGKINFIKENKIKSIYLKDDGKLEIYDNNRLINETIFAKQLICDTCKNIIEEGYDVIDNRMYTPKDIFEYYLEKGFNKLQAAEFLTSIFNFPEIDEKNLNEEELNKLINKLEESEEINYEKEKQGLQSQIKKADELNKLKNELDNKLGQLNENLINKDTFPSNELTEKELTLGELKSINLEKFLNEDQIKWLNDNSLIKDSNLQELNNALHTLAKDLDSELDIVNHNPMISFKEYINII